MKKAARIGTLAMLFAVFCLSAAGQGAVCKSSTKKISREIPRLAYDCAGNDESDEKILMLPARIGALDRLASELGGFKDAQWWRTPTAELDACLSLTKSAENEPPPARIYGNDATRVVQVFDPCYQTHYGGSAIFLLVRSSRAAVVTPLIDDFFSRDPEISVNFASNGAERLVEIATANSAFNIPMLTNYYFKIVPVSKKAAARNLFVEDGKPTNMISSLMDLSGKKSTSAPLGVFRNGKLSASFYKLTDPSGNQRLRKVALRWNGRRFK